MKDKNAKINNIYAQHTLIHTQQTHMIMGGRDKNQDDSMLLNGGIKKQNFT